MGSGYQVTASGRYQMTGAVGGPGIGHIEVGTDGGRVALKPWRGDIMLDAAKQEEFAQLYVAACHRAAANREAERLAEADGVSGRG